MDRAGASDLVERGLTVHAPACDTVPADRTGTHQLVDHRTHNDVELLGDSLSKSLLTGEQGVEHASRARARGVLESTGSLHEEGTLVLADLTGPDRARSGVHVRSTPACDGAGLRPKVVGDLRVNGSPVEGTLPGKGLTSAELGDRSTDIAGLDDVGTGDGAVGSGVDEHRATRFADDVGTAHEDVQHHGVNGVNHVERDDVGDSRIDVGEAEEVQQTGAENGVAVLGEGDRNSGRVPDSNGVRIDSLGQSAGGSTQIGVEAEDDRRTRLVLLCGTLVGDLTVKGLGTKLELDQSVICGLDERGNRAGTSICIGDDRSLLVDVPLELLESLHQFLGSTVWVVGVVLDFVKAGLEIRVQGSLVGCDVTLGLIAPLFGFSEG